MELELLHPLPLMYSKMGASDHPQFMDMVFNWLVKHGPKTAKELEQETGLSMSSVKKAVSHLSKTKVNKVEKLNPGSRPTLYGAVQTAPAVAQK